MVNFQPVNVGLASGNPLYDWNFVTVPQPGANERSIAAPRCGITFLFIAFDLTSLLEASY